MNAIHLLRPGWVMILLPLLVILMWLWRRRLRSRSWQAVCDPALLPHLLLGRSRRRANWPLWLLTLGYLLAVLALAGPAWRKLPQPLFRQQSALVILLDLSNSMAAADLKPSRIERAKLKVADLLRLRREGHTALIVFAGDAFVVTPLTDDSQTIDLLLSKLSPALMPVQGSEPQKAIQLGLELMQQAGLKQGKLLLITDEDRPDRALTAAQDAAAKGFELAVIGVGTPSGAPIPLAGGGFFKDREGDLVLPRLDEDGLQKLAARGSGPYRQLSIDDSDLSGVLRESDQHRFDKSEQVAGKTGQRWREEGVVLLWPLTLLAALAFRRGWLALLLFILIPPPPVQALTWQDLWLRPEQQAARAFEDGQYDQAQQLFQSPRWKASSLYRTGQFEEAAEVLEQPETADDWYNKGNALARSGRFQQAVQAYEQALKRAPDHQDAAANRKIVEEALEQQQATQGSDQQQGGQPSDQGDPGSRKGDSDSQQSAQQDQAQSADQPRQGQPQDQSQQEQQGSPLPHSESQDAEANRTGLEQVPAGSPGEDSQGVGSEDSPEPQSVAEGISEMSDDAPDSEQQRAIQQWLQRIPDDPGELLRRKFLYQYRQRGRQQETDRPW
ncbi:MAG: hypothetical protein C0614_09495 [Desulfuromonas sp.]|nr:MAG: hypothetical protein C0614_09495 [Desulfuromonas sp.]